VRELKGGQGAFKFSWWVDKVIPWRAGRYKGGVLPAALASDDGW
jgi:hypothetical protein